MSPSANENKPEGQETTTEAVRGLTAAYSIEFSPDISIWNESRRLIADRNLRVEDLAVCASQDPAIVIELLKTANALYFSAGKSPITSVKTAIVRLGADIAIELFEKIKERPRIEDADVSHWFEFHRSRCKRVAIMARMLAEILTRTLGDDCCTAGLLLGVGEMLAVAHLKERYVELADDVSRTAIIYRLVQDYRFDIEKVGVNYLRKHGIPEVLIFALDRDARPPSQERAIMKPICQAAQEMVDTFDGNKWEKLAPGRQLPPKSPLRSLQIPDTQYLKVYERASEFFFSSRLLDEKKKLERQTITFLAPNETTTPSAPPASNTSLNDEISALLDDSQEGASFEEEEELSSSDQETSKPQTTINSLPLNLETTKDQFSLKTAQNTNKSVPRLAPLPSRVAPPQITSERGARVVTDIGKMLGDARSSEELLSNLLDMLLADNCFTKSALIVVSRDRRKAIVVCARGENIGNGQTIDITNPLSPLAQCFSKVQSWGNKESEHSPFGSSSFALAPIDADHETPVALYADCGSSGSISFDARRVFRTVVELLNEKLPQIPGGIPIEVET